MQDVTMYPMTASLKIHITDGEQVGSVTYGGGHGKLYTESDMLKVLEEVKACLPDGFRLMNRAESTMFYLREEKGYRGPNMVIPKSGKWHDPEADVEWSDTANEPEEEDEY